MANQRKLALVGFHEREVMDLMLLSGVREFRTGKYSGMILTGTSNPSNRAGDFVKNPSTPRASAQGFLSTRDLCLPTHKLKQDDYANTNDRCFNVNDELAFMGYFLSHEHPDVPVIDRIPARTLMGNMGNVLRKHNKGITFYVDKSQVSRAKQSFLPYFRRTREGIEDVEVLSPLVSYRAGTNYENHTSRMDSMYKIALRMPVIDRITEALACDNSRLVSTVVKAKNRIIQKMPN